MRVPTEFRKPLKKYAHTSHMVDFVAGEDAHSKSVPAPVLALLTCPAALQLSCPLHVRPRSTFHSLPIHVLSLFQSATPLAEMSRRLKPVAERMPVTVYLSHVLMDTHYMG